MLTPVIYICLTDYTNYLLQLLPYMIQLQSSGLPHHFFMELRDFIFPCSEKKMTEKNNRQSWSWGILETVQLFYQLHPKASRASPCMAWKHNLRTAAFQLHCKHIKKPCKVQYADYCKISCKSKQHLTQCITVAFQPMFPSHTSQQKCIP